MYCRKCGNKIVDGENVCSACGEGVSENNAHTEASGEKASVTSKILPFFSKIKEKLGIKPIFDDNYKRSPMENALSSKYLLLGVVTLILIIFWLSNTLLIELPDIEGVEVGGISTSINDIVSGVSVAESLLESLLVDVEGEVDLDEVEPLISVLKVAVFVFRLAFILLVLAPVFAFFALFARSVDKGYWLSLERVCLISSFVIHLVFYLILSIFTLLLREGDINLNLKLNFGGVLFLFLYIFAFFVLRSISKALKDNAIMAEAQRLEKSEVSE